MNEGFKHYISLGLSDSRQTLKHSKVNLIKFYFLCFIELIGSLTLIFYPIFRLSKIRAYRMARKTKNISITRSFEALNKPKSFLNTIFASLILFVLFLAGILVIALFTALLAGFGYVVSGMKSEYTYYIAGIFAIPGALALLVYLILFPLYFMPYMYIIDKKPDMGISNVLANSYNSMKKTGKRTLIMLTIVYVLLTLLILILCAIVPVGLFAVYKFLYTHEAVYLASLITAIIFGFIYLMIIPKYAMGYRLSVTALYDDIISTYEYDNDLVTEYFKDPTLPKQSQVDPNVKASKKTKAKKKEDILISLFSDSYTKEAASNNPEVEGEEAERLINDMSLDEVNDKASDKSFEEKNEVVSDDEVSKVIFQDEDTKENEVDLDNTDSKVKLDDTSDFEPTFDEEDTDASKEEIEAVLDSIKEEMETKEAEVKEEPKEEEKPEPKEEVEPEVKEETVEEPKAETKDEPIEEPKPEVKEEVKPETAEEPKEEPKPEVKEEPKEEVKEEIVEEPKPETKEEVKEKPKKTSTKKSTKEESSNGINDVLKKIEESKTTKAKTTKKAEVKEEPKEEVKEEKPKRGRKKIEPIPDEVKEEKEDTRTVEELNEEEVNEFLDDDFDDDSLDSKSIDELRDMLDKLKENL